MARLGCTAGQNRTLRFSSVLGLVLSLSLIQSCGQTHDICTCTPTEPASQDFRHGEKHVPLPNLTPTETTVGEMLTWPLGPDPGNDTPRGGRELVLYHIANAYLENARLISFDCDIHLEISNVPDKTAPRVIVETPIDSEYCANRRALETALAQQRFQLQYVDQSAISQAELPKPLPVSVLGLGFRDFEHNRGTPEVATTWELHPAQVTVP
jgi:hypothetical protein